MLPADTADFTLYSTHLRWMSHPKVSQRILQITSHDGLQPYTVQDWGAPLMSIVFI